MSTQRIPDAVRRVFTETFAARDVAEPLASFDAGAPSGNVRAFMEARGFDVVGVRRDGQVAGFVRADALGNGRCGEHLQPLDAATVLDDSAPLLTVLQALDRVPFGFVAVFGRVGGIITRSDLQKAPVRMWLFGVVTMIEMRFADLVEQHCPADGWTEFLSEARLQKARDFQAERARRRLDVSLIDCLQFSDKGQIIARHEAMRGATIFASRRQAEEAVKRLEQLRNNLAHAQEIVSDDWATVAQLCDLIARQ